MFIILISVIIISSFVFILKNILYTVPNNYAYVVERNGQYHLTAEAGPHNKNPFSDKIVCKCCLLASNINITKQPIITQDNKTIFIEGCVVYKIITPKLYKYGADNVPLALDILSATTLRSLLGECLYNEIDKENRICDKALQIIQSASAQWGIDVLSITYQISYMEGECNE